MVTLLENIVIDAADPGHWLGSGPPRCRAGCSSRAARMTSSIVASRPSTVPARAAPAMPALTAPATALAPAFAMAALRRRGFEP